jgi:putative cardiolipin synthase
VRVRLLVDDRCTAGEDDLLLGLASYPNAEVRPFIPEGELQVSDRLLLSRY